jgi:hypothetical protein
METAKLLIAFTFVAGGGALAVAIVYHVVKSLVVGN